MEVTKRISPSLTETNTFGFELADLNAFERNLNANREECIRTDNYIFLN